MLSERIRLARKVRNLTQSDLAKKVNTTKATISNYENKYSSPSGEMISLLADALQTTTDFLLGKTDKIDNVPYWELSDKDHKEIDIDLDKILDGNGAGNVNYYGEPLTEEEKEKVATAIRIALEMNKKEAKKRFTPKKYRDK
ncbi:helix-turn-helix domain-containing protein [Listeria aquatica]|uniref:Helix-turn-helix domain-containing protein n=1 Tax=Listeria aquatica TaxID=1494960 RepID=A0A841ZQH0_9LIST|nr:helix-turn-helix domain-containing protein [Listeria aquatica]MBC1521435.1 helix-turn-helix domain-containing protein [Listeria aquatica]